MCLFVNSFFDYTKKHINIKIDEKVYLVYLVYLEANFHLSDLGQVADEPDLDGTSEKLAGAVLPIIIVPMDHHVVDPLRVRHPASSAAGARQLPAPGDRCQHSYIIHQLNCQTTNKNCSVTFRKRGNFHNY